MEPKRECLKIPAGSATITFIAIFRETVRVNLRLTLPYNTLVGVVDEDDSDCPHEMENLLTRERWTAHKGDFFFTPAGLPVAYHNRLSRKHIAVHFKLEIFPGYDVFWGQKNWISQYSPEKVQQMTEIFETRDSALRLCRFEAFALEYCIAHWPENVEEKIAGVSAISDILVYARENINAGMTVAVLAQRKGCSTEYFSRIFSALMKQSPKTFLQNELLQKSMELLLSPKLNIAEVAEKLDFSSAFYFSRFFKRRTGLTPREYRQANGF
ncbi:MAG: AraC family transcriptional regulator [Victivallales bacterium]|nr:AraC family transcriptional regulator [Victivallales bacterium]